MNTLKTLETANKVIAIAAVPVFAIAVYESITYEIASKRCDAKFRALHKMVDDPFADLSPEAKRVLYGK